jgi:MoxR-like ATPase
MTPHEAILELQRRMETAIIGQQHVIQRLLLTLLCNGNCLLEEACRVWPRRAP